MHKELLFCSACSPPKPIPRFMGPTPVYSQGGQEEDGFDQVLLQAV